MKMKISGAIKIYLKKIKMSPLNLLMVLKAAVENIYIARLLADYPPSKEISDQITHGNGLLAGLEESFASPEELQGFVIKNLNNLHVPLVESFCRNAYEHSVNIINKNYPDLELPEELPQVNIKKGT